MPVEAILEKRESRNGNEYYCIIIKITDKVEKFVLLDRAEAELIRLTHASQKIKMSSSQNQ